MSVDGTRGGRPGGGSREGGGARGAPGRAGRGGLVALPGGGSGEPIAGVAGPLQALIDEPGVSDVLVNAPDEVWVDRGAGLERRAVDLGGAERLRALAVRLAAAGGQRLDDACPVADARLPDGTRLHAVLPPLAPDGVLLSLRVPRAEPFSLAELVADGSVAPPLGPVLAGLVRGRANGLLTGATGTGKTTLLAALLALVPATERLVCVEEVAELAPDHPHVVHLVARRANVEGAGEVGLVELVRHALRMRPDRIVLGECRGAEVREVLTALNTGHEGGWATMHANAPADVPARLAALAALAGLTGRALDAQVLGALHVVVHLRRSGSRRYVSDVGLVTRDEDGALVVRDAAHVATSGVVRPGPAWRELVARWPAAEP